MTSHFREYTVSHPPTSDGVRERVRATLGSVNPTTRAGLEFTVLSSQEVPKPTEEQLVLTAARLTFHKDRLDIIEGTLVTLRGVPASERQSVIIHLAESAGEAATATIVTVSDS